MDLLRLLRTFGPNIWGARIKLVRHADARLDVHELRRRGFLDDYERRQGKPVFEGAEYILSFVGERGTRARFLRCRRVVGVSAEVPPYPDGHPYPELPLGTHWYDFAAVPGFEDLEDRVVIDWGRGALAWVQWLDEGRPKRVIEVLPAGHGGEFPGYDEVVLRFDELQRIVSQPEANHAWHVALRAIAAVYLITDRATGDQYVGSARGADGLLGRWRSYAKSGGHGGNVHLRTLVGDRSARAADLQFSILRTLPLDAPREDVLAVESVYMRKLGTRAFGLND